jgi:hypothetical protein
MLVLDEALMSGLSHGSWLPRLLFLLTLGLAGSLVLMLIFAPWLDAGSPRPHSWDRLLAVFARDLVVRRTAVGAAVGLLVTAFVCFRQPAAKPRASKAPSPPRNIAGA